MESRVELIKLILQELLQASDTDSSDSDYEASESESDDYEDSEEETETDLTHIDPKNILGTWTAPVIPKENSEKNI